MKINSIRVQNFRCVYDETLQCENLTALIGQNSSGKSTFLRALDMFYSPSSVYSEEDFYNRDTSEDIKIIVTFDDLIEGEKKLFQKYVQGGKLTVEKIVRWSQNRIIQKYHGTSLQNLEFDTFRTASGTDLRKTYKEFQENGYADLPEYQNKEDAKIALQTWEENHPDQCSRRRDDGQFFGFKEVGKANLERFTRFILVPAVREASDDVTEKKGSPLTEIMDFVVRSTLMQREEIIKLQEDIKEKYEQIMDPKKLTELQNLERVLSETLTTYVPGTEVKLNWLSEEIFDIPMPKADIKLVEDEYSSSVERTGHGLQRALILTMLQHLAFVQMLVQEDVIERKDELNENPQEQSSPQLSNLILAIEEPELYQHPNRQRHLAKILLKLVEGNIKGLANRTQIIYSTHSPLFVDIKLLDKIRLVHKVQGDTNKPKNTKVIHTNLDNVAKILEKVCGLPEGSFTGKSLEPRLQTLMTPWMNEGFFADVVVLVEGEEDRAAILGIAAELGHDFESLGISVIPCMGKTNIDRPTIIFKELQIQVYAIWDSDFDFNNKDAKSEINRRLLGLFNHPVEDWPEKITEQFACFKQTLRDTLRTEIGEQLYKDILEECCKRLDLIENKHAFKNPQVVQEVIKEAKKQGKSSESLETIISQIVSLKNQ